MRLKIPFLALSAALLASCAYQGTVVQKDAMPHPFYLSQGIDGKYAFILQDKAGVRHRQLVTPEVYERYAVGDYFDDMQTTTAGTTDDSKNVQRTAPVMTASVKPRAATQRLAVATPKAKAVQLAAPSKPATKTNSIAVAKVKARKRALAKSKNARPVAKPVTIAAITPTPQVAAATPQADTGFAVVMIDRCR